MPISFENLQYTVHRAEHAQSLQNTQVGGERAGLAAAAVVSQDQAKAQESAQVQTSTQTEMEASGGGGGGAMAMATNTGEEEQKPPGRQPGDPAGRGHLIDVTA